MERQGKINNLGQSPQCKSRHFF